MRGRGRRPKEPKKPKYQLIDPKTQEGGAIHAMITALVREHHDSDLRDARIAAAWMVGVKADRDGRVVLGRMRKASELDREFVKHDLVLVLNRDQWHVLSEPQRLALVDHELCHARASLDSKTLEPVHDAHGNRVYRLRKHDVEEFREIVERHGLWKADVELFAASTEKAKQLSLEPKKEKAGPKPLPAPGKAARAAAAN